MTVATNTDYHSVSSSQDGSSITIEARTMDPSPADGSNENLQSVEEPIALPSSPTSPHHRRPHISTLLGPAGTGGFQFSHEHRHDDDAVPPGSPITAGAHLRKKFKRVKTRLGEILMLFCSRL